MTSRSKRWSMIGMTAQGRSQRIETDRDPKRPFRHRRFRHACQFDFTAAALLRSGGSERATPRIEPARGIGDGPKPAAPSSRARTVDRRAVDILMLAPAHHARGVAGGRGRTHPQVPASAPITQRFKRHAMLVLCARQHGLIVSVTRLVRISANCRQICAAAIPPPAPSTPSLSTARISTPCARSSATWLPTPAGFSDEWQLHHQGGPCGYPDPRVILATACGRRGGARKSGLCLRSSITGTKSEDTILATSRSPQILTASRDWPM